MSEIKRVQFTTISNNVNTNNLGGSATNVTNSDCKKSHFTGLLQSHHDVVATTPIITAAAESGNSGGSGSKILKTFRHELELFEPNSDTFPEFNFSKLMHIEKKKQKKLKQKQSNVTSDPFEENDDDVARIAKEMEMKYGSSYATGRKKAKTDDLCDKGLGYDETDSFIDNTEAYDEIIPDEVETVEGGFYINSGQLEFKHLTKYDLETEEIVKMVRAKKRILSTSSEESEEDEEDEDSNIEIDTEDKPSKETDVAKIKNGHREKKHKSSGDDSSSSKSKVKDIKKLSQIKEVRSGEEGANSDSGKDKPAVKTTTVKDMLKAKRDNFLKMQDDKVKMNGVKSGNSSESSEDESDSDAGPSKKKYKTGDEDDSEKIRTSDIKLPDDLPDDLIKDIKEVKDTAKSSNRMGKNFQFDEKFTELFLRIDDAAVCLEKTLRNQIFAHIEFQLQLSKYFLLRKAKQLRIKQEKTKTKKSYLKLKNAVAKVMPSVINSYEAAYKQLSEMRAKLPPNELEKPDQALKLPKKKFPWNESMRNLLYDLYQIRWTSYTVLHTRKETFEDFVNSYLRDKVVPIWPTGWMKSEELKKELEKRKNSGKKLKENKKIQLGSDLTPSVTIPNSSVVPKSTAPSTNIITKNKPNDNIVISNSDTTKNSIVNKQPISVVTSNLTVTISSANSSKLSSNEVPLKPQQNSISIIPVPENSKQSSQKTSNSSNIGISKINSNNSNNKIDKVNSKNINSNVTTTIIDLISPSKRTDHSISSIISSTSPSSSTTSGSQNVGESLTTHVITVDDFKNTSDIMSTSSKILINNNNNNSNNNNNNSNRQKNPLNINKNSIDIIEKSRRDTIESISSSSDSVEFVDIIPTSPVEKKSKIMINKNKFIKHKLGKSRSASPINLNIKKDKNTNGNGSDRKIASGSDNGKVKENDCKVNSSNLNVVKSNSSELDRLKKIDETNSESGGENKDSDIDVNQLMKQLKDLREMQQAHPGTASNLSKEVKQ